MDISNPELARESTLYSRPPKHSSIGVLLMHELFNIDPTFCFKIRLVLHAWSDCYARKKYLKTFHIKKIYELKHS